MFFSQTDGWVMSSIFIHVGHSLVHLLRVEVVFTCCTRADRFRSRKHEVEAVVRCSSNSTVSERRVVV